MKVTAKLNQLRIAPRKVRLVADLIRGKSTKEAETILYFQTKRAAHQITKLLKSAVANAKNNFKLNENHLYISKLTVDGGPHLKRWRPRSRGRAYPILKKTSHVTLVLDEIELKKRQKKVTKMPAIKTPIKIPKLRKKQHGS